MLLGLYFDLIKNIGCSASKIHSWWKNGELPLNIKKTYDDAGNDNKYYKWFLKNEHGLQGLHKYECKDETLRDEYSNHINPNTINQFLSIHFRNRNLTLLLSTQS